MSVTHTELLHLREDLQIALAVAPQNERPKMAFFLDVISEAEDAQKMRPALERIAQGAAAPQFVARSTLRSLEPGGDAQLTWSDIMALGDRVEAHPYWGPLLLGSVLGMALLLFYGAAWVLT
jgi:hypothetical protein